MHHFLLRTIKIICLPVMVWSLAACNKEAKLTPTKVPDFYTLPQGNQPYDDSIVAFHKKYGTYILYKFTNIDFAYDYNNYITYTATIGNPAYVGQTLDYFRTQCLDYYPESFLRKTLPLKIILAAHIDSLYSLGDVMLAHPSVTGFAASSSMMAIGWTDSTLTKKTPAELAQMKGWLHSCYAQQAIKSGSISIPPVFIKLAPNDYAFLPAGGKYAAGLIDDYNNGGTLLIDFLSYITAITSHTRAELDATILNPAVDINGLIQGKYDAIINYYQSQFGVDLQAIGNHS
ncbi:hypothetical protein CLV51_103524 [Chitinophaga niastensis]|uniref:Uncharacterized protein n=1 Tax=Chitinophaga niastensis TaxID=536980 RepID=A0A2P8HJZ4_CHINA|nr:hypothetical protein [Chitinophaga niastensis]PSL46543.1 hypothetical protein CLV51_103524 [Chitinophaga niastensis]